MSSHDEQCAAAAKLFESFHHRAPRGQEIMQLAAPQTPDVGLEVGEYLEIAYKAKGDGKRYLHEFPAANRPKVYVSYDGRQIYVVGGVYRFSSRGFID